MNCHFDKANILYRIFSVDGFERMYNTYMNYFIILPKYPNTQISNKSETDFKYFCLKYMNRQKN